MKLGPFTFGYNATEDKGRRQAPRKRIYREEKVLTDVKRKKLIATTQDQVRNLTLVPWMVRKHLDYTANHHFEFKTGNDKLDATVNRIFKWHGRPENFDFMGRFGRDEFFRLFELEKVVSGDAAMIKLQGQKLQAIESDEIRLCSDMPDIKLANGASISDSGIVVDAQGRPIGYSICRRTDSGGYEFDHIEPSENVIFDGYWSRYKSQYRGVSPLAASVNTVQDLYEALEFNLIKAKMHALFGLAITRDPNDDEGGFGGAGGSTAEVSDAEAQDNGSHLDLNVRAVNILDMNPGDKVQVIESGTPSSEFIDASYLYIQLGMLALDIPVTCFDSRRSSFSARIADLNEYEVSCEPKRTKNRYVRMAYSDWLLRTIWNDPSSAWPLRALATEAGIGLRDVQSEVHWIASGSPWLDKYKQILGDELGIALGLDNGIDAARRRGMDIFENIDKQSKVIEYAKAKGVPLKTGAMSDRVAIESISKDGEE